MQAESAFRIPFRRMFHSFAVTVRAKTPCRRTTRNAASPPRCRGGAAGIGRVVAQPLSDPRFQKERSPKRIVIVSFRVFICSASCRMRSRLRLAPEPPPFVHRWAAARTRNAPTDTRPTGSLALTCRVAWRDLLDGVPIHDGHHVSVSSAPLHLGVVAQKLAGQTQTDACFLTRLIVGDDSNATGTSRGDGIGRLCQQDVLPGWLWRKVSRRPGHLSQSISPSNCVKSAGISPSPLAAFCFSLAKASSLARLQIGLLEAGDRAGGIAAFEGVESLGVGSSPLLSSPFLRRRTTTCCPRCRRPVTPRSVRRPT